MALKDELEIAVKDVFKYAWQRRDGEVVPESENIQLGNHGVNLNAVILYADLASSTVLVDNETPEFAAECYKTFLHCATKIIRSEGGHIRSFDGDRVMGIFIGDAKNSTAARCALKINWAVLNIIQPALNAQYPSKTYKMIHKVGIDQSPIMAARTGIRGANDIVWVGSAANHAAKLCAVNDDGYATFITQRVYDALSPEAKKSNNGNGVDMWEQRSWNSSTVYRSNYWWPIQ
jgi:class 3 adenylate cyclase